MSKLSVFAAAALGAALAALHITSTKSAADQLKDAAQREMDAYKPAVIDLVKSKAAQLEGAVVTQTDVAQLQSDLFNAIDKTSLPDLAKTALKVAVVDGVNDANAAKITQGGLSLLSQAANYIIAKIQAARL